VECGGEEQAYRSSSWHSGGLIGEDGRRWDQPGGRVCASDKSQGEGLATPIGAPCADCWPPVSRPHQRLGVNAAATLIDQDGLYYGDTPRARSGVDMRVMLARRCFCSGKRDLHCILHDQVAGPGLLFQRHLPISTIPKTIPIDTRPSLPRPDAFSALPSSVPSCTPLTP
jgi:hypothetical protein